MAYPGRVDYRLIRLNDPDNPRAGAEVSFNGDGQPGELAKATAETFGLAEITDYPPGQDRAIYFLVVEESPQSGRFKTTRRFEILPSLPTPQSPAEIAAEMATISTQ